MNNLKYIEVCKLISLRLLLFLIIISSNSCSSPLIGEYYNGLASIQEVFSRKYGFVDKNNNVVIEPKYDWVTGFESNYSVVEINGLRGLIDKKGQIKIPIKYENVEPFYPYGSNCYVIRELNGKQGVFSSNNEEIIPAVAFNIDGKLYEEKYIKVQLKENSYLIYDLKGNRLTKPSKGIVNIYKNYSIFKIDVDPNEYYSDSYGKRIESWYKIIDLEKPYNKLNDKKYFYVDTLDLAIDEKEIMFRVNSSEIIDKNGVTIISDSKYCLINNFGEGMFNALAVGLGEGYCDVKGNWIIKPIFTETEPFIKGRAKVTFKDRVFYIDKDGNCVSDDCPTKKWFDFYQIENFKINKGRYNQLIARGIKESKDLNYEKSIETFTQATFENPMDYEVYYNRALSYLLNNSFKEAKVDINKALEFNSEKAELYYIRANINIKLGEMYSVIDDLKRVIEINPNFIDGYLKLAVIYGQKGDKSSACFYFKKACDIGSAEACDGYSQFCN